MIFSGKRQGFFDEKSDPARHERPDGQAGHPSPRYDKEVAQQFRLLMRYLAIITARQGKEIAGVGGDLA